MKKLIIGTAIGLSLLASSAFAGKIIVSNIFVTDHYKTVTEEVCTGGGNFVEGAIIGGILGKLFDNPEAGIIIGGVLHENDGKKCELVEKQVYDYSTISFNYNWKNFTLTFKK